MYRIGSLIYSANLEPFIGENSDMTRDLYGLDSFTQKWIMPNHRLDEFLRKWPAATKNAQYHSFGSVMIPSIRIGRAWTEATIEFAGKVDDNDSEVRVVDDTFIATIQGQTNGGTLMIDYHGMTTTYFYAVKSRPTAPRFTPAIGTFPVPGIEVIEKRGVLQLGGVDFTDANAGLRARCRLQPPFKREQHGFWWKCEETWAWALEQRAEFFAPGVVLIA